MRDASSRGRMMAVRPRVGRDMSVKFPVRRLVTAWEAMKGGKMNIQISRYWSSSIPTVLTT